MQAAVQRKQKVSCSLTTNCGNCRKIGCGNAPHLLNPCSECEVHVMLVKYDGSNLMAVSEKTGDRAKSVVSGASTFPGTDIKMDPRTARVVPLLPRRCDEKFTSVTHCDR